MYNWWSSFVSTLATRFERNVYIIYYTKGIFTMSQDTIIPIRLIKPSDKKSDGTLSYPEMVNGFLSLANEHFKTIEMDDISAAMREATARFNAFEAQYKSHNLKIDRDNAISWFSEEFTKSLTEYVDELIDKNPVQ